MEEIIDINEDNVDLDGLFCKKSQKKQIGYQNKVTWIKKRFKEGLKYKMLMMNISPESITGVEFKLMGGW
jgi:hypothetical protein